MRAGPAGRPVPVHLRWAVCLRLITGLGGVDGMFTAGHFNEIRLSLIYEKGKAPLSFSLSLVSLISMHEGWVSLIKKKKKKEASFTKHALELLFKVFTSIYFIVIIPAEPWKRGGGGVGGMNVTNVGVNLT